MKVSVIIPVYNAAAFVKEAVESALAQPQTGEILLIEDGSQDDSLARCKNLSGNPRVRLLTHPGNANQGAAASRNLGLDQASMPYIAFLDADDMYLPGRFSATEKIFDQNPDADGVHEMIGTKYHHPKLREQHIARAGGEQTGIRKEVAPGDLFQTLATGKYGHIHLNGLTLKRTSLTQEFRFDTAFVMSEDMDFILRLSVQKKFYGGDPSRIVALRGVHTENSVFHNPRMIFYRRSYLQKCIDHDFYGAKDLKGIAYIISRRVGAGKFFMPFKGFGRIALPFKLIGIGGYILTHPQSFKGILRGLANNS